MTELRILSSNIWWCDLNHPQWEEKGGDCSCKTRAAGLARLYEEIGADIIGLQECSGRMTHQLMTQLFDRNLPYAYLWGHDTPILYRSDLFVLLDSRVCIYPEEIPGLEGSFNNLKTKAYCIAVLQHKHTGDKLIFATTHLWYKSGDPASPGYYPHSEEARAWQMNRLIDAVEELHDIHQCPIVMVGDFNTWPTGAAVRTALGRGFEHAHGIATEYADDTTGMHFCCDKGWAETLNPGDFSHSIDHILVKDVKVFRYERYNPDYFFPLTDHSPLWIDAEI